MSWGKSLAGTPDEIRDQMSKVAAEVEKNDRSFTSTTEGIIAAHQKQVKATCEIVEHALTLIPEGYAASAHISGHAGEDSAA